MKEFKITVPDHQIPTVLEFIEYLKAESVAELDIPESHKTLVRGRIASATPDSYIPWDEAVKRMKGKK